MKVKFTKQMLQQIKNTIEELDKEVEETTVTFSVKYPDNMEINVYNISKVTCVNNIDTNQFITFDFIKKVVKDFKINIQGNEIAGIVSGTDNKDHAKIKHVVTRNSLREIDFVCTDINNHFSGSQYIDLTIINIVNIDRNKVTAVEQNVLREAMKNMHNTNKESCVASNPKKGSEMKAKATDDIVRELKDANVETDKFAYAEVDIPNTNPVIFFKSKFAGLDKLNINDISIITCVSESIPNTLIEFDLLNGVLRTIGNDKPILRYTEGCATIESYMIHEDCSKIDFICRKTRKSFLNSRQYLNLIIISTVDLEGKISKCPKEINSAMNLSLRNNTTVEDLKKTAVDVAGEYTKGIILGEEEIIRPLSAEEFEQFKCGVPTGPRPNKRISEPEARMTKMYDCNHTHPRYDKELPTYVESGFGRFGSNLDRSALTSYLSKSPLETKQGCKTIELRINKVPSYLAYNKLPLYSAAKLYSDQKLNYEDDYLLYCGSSENESIIVDLEKNVVYDTSTVSPSDIEDRECFSIKTEGMRELFRIKAYTATPISLYSDIAIMNILCEISSDHSEKQGRTYDTIASGKRSDSTEDKNVSKSEVKNDVDNLNGFHNLMDENNTDPFQKAFTETIKKENNNKSSHLTIEEFTGKSNNIKKIKIEEFNIKKIKIEELSSLENIALIRINTPVEQAGIIIDLMARRIRAASSHENIGVITNIKKYKKGNNPTGYAFKYVVTNMPCYENACLPFEELVRAKYLNVELLLKGSTSFIPASSIALNKKKKSNKVNLEAVSKDFADALCSKAKEVPTLEFRFEKENGKASHKHIKIYLEPNCKSFLKTTSATAVATLRNEELDWNAIIPVNISLVNNVISIADIEFLWSIDLKYEEDGRPYLFIKDKKSKLIKQGFASF